MRVLIAIPAQDHATGNWVTARRFERGLTGHGFEVRLAETGLDPEALQAAVRSWRPAAILLLHAYRTGKPWLEAVELRNIPTLVLLTGTDINLGLDNPEQAPVIREVMALACKVLFQNRLLTERILSHFQGREINLDFLPPGIELGQTPYPLRGRHAIDPNMPLLLCPASLRPVKGVLELLTLIDPVAARSIPFHVAFCGPALDDDYSRRFLAEIELRPWASYLGTIPAEAMASAMTEADIILNNSSAEGLPNALIEASVLGKPILARNIPGNAAVVEDGLNGRLYRNDQEFTAAVERLLTDPGLCQNLSCPDPSRYKAQREAVCLANFLEQALPDGKSSALI